MTGLRRSGDMGFMNWRSTWQIKTLKCSGTWTFQWWHVKTDVCIAGCGETKSNLQNFLYVVSMSGNLALKTQTWQQYPESHALGPMPPVEKGNDGDSNLWGLENMRLVCHKSRILRAFTAPETTKHSGEKKQKRSSSNHFRKNLYSTGKVYRPGSTDIIRHVTKVLPVYLWQAENSIWQCQTLELFKIVEFSLNFSTTSTLLKQNIIQIRIFFV